MNKIFHLSQADVDYFTYCNNPRCFADPPAKTETKVKRVFQQVYKQTNWKIQPPVKVPGAYNVWAAGTNGDVTLLAWYHDDGSMTCKAIAW